MKTILEEKIISEVSAEAQIPIFENLGFLIDNEWSDKRMNQEQTMHIEKKKIMKIISPSSMHPENG